MELKGKIVIYSYDRAITTYENGILRKYPEYIEVEYEVYQFNNKLDKYISTDKWKKAYYSSNIVWKVS